MDDHEKHHGEGPFARAKAVIVRSRYRRSTRKGPDTLVSGPFRALLRVHRSCRGGRKSGRVQPAFPETHHSPPSGFGAIDPAGIGTSTPTISTMSRASISCRVLSDP